MSQRFDGPAGARQVRLASRRDLIRRTTMFGLAAMLALVLVGPQSAQAQGLLQRWLGRSYSSSQSRQRSSLASQAARTTVVDFFDDTVTEAGKRMVGASLDAASPKAGKVWKAYHAVEAGNRFLNSGTPGSPANAVKAVVAVDAIVGGPLTQVGVGPQAVLAAGVARSTAKFTMNKLEEGTAVLHEGFAQQHLDAYRQIGNPGDLARSAMAAKPDVKYRDLESWNGKGVLRINPDTGPAKPISVVAVTVPDLSNSWKTTVTKPSFQTDAKGVGGRAADWVQWKLDPHNIQIKSDFDRTFVGNDGVTRIQIQQHQTGYGYQPGQTQRYESVRTSFQGNRTETWQPICIPLTNGAASRSPGSSQRVQTTRVGTGGKTYSGPSTSRPSYSRPSVPRPSVSRPSFSPPSFPR